MHRVSPSEPSQVGSGAPIDLLGRIDPARDTVQGMWWFDRGTLVCTRRMQEPHGDGKNCQVRLPVDLPSQEYRVTAVIERCVGEDLVRFCLPTHRGEPHVIVDGFPLEGWRSAFWGVPGDHHTPGMKLPRGKTCTLVCEVRTSGIQVSLAGETLLEWQGDWKDVPEREPLRHLQVDAYDTTFRIHRLTWEPLGQAPSEVSLTALKPRDHKTYWHKLETTAPTR